MQDQQQQVNNCNSLNGNARICGLKVPSSASCLPAEELGDDEAVAKIAAKHMQAAGDCCEAGRAI